ncbi:MAG TPA: AAA family ATPase, partial [Pseudonocardiaceae bacterium]|nr:AAA family ATPase [Pseudonocardiaceae bacterium]
MSRFAADLRAVREGAGTPAYRELARRAHFSTATLSEAAAGRKLPSLPVTLAYVRACGADPTEWAARWRSAAGELAAAQLPDPKESAPSPYVGLATFQPADADRFFGRERLVDELADRVAQRPVTTVFGPSGSGKSSILRAGLIPRLSDRQHGEWPVLLMTPGEQPMVECAAQLARLLGMPAGTVLADLNADPRHLDLAVRQVLAERPDSARLVLVVDQFEEAFTLCRDGVERGHFIAAVLAAAGAANSRTRVVLGVRADFYG